MPTATTRALRTDTGTAMLDQIIAAASAVFIVILATAAYWDPTIRVLHAFESIPYATAAALCLRRHKAGYMLAWASGAFWLWMAGTLTTFVRGGFVRVGMLLRTGHVDRWDQFIAAPAALATTALIMLSLWGYARLQSRRSADALGFAAAFVVVGGYFLLLFWAITPQYLLMFRRFLP